MTQPDSFTLLRPLAVAIARLLTPFCEVVIHDFRDLEHSIVHIEGDISHRRVGGSATDLLLQCVQRGQTGDDLHNYLTSLPDGRLMKSSTIFLRDAKGAAYGAFCINLEITAFVQFRRLLGDVIVTEERGSLTEHFVDDIGSTLQTMIADTLYELEMQTPLMTRDDKVALIARLDAKGAFQVKKAVPLLADQLGLSRATVYNYLSEARHHTGHPHHDETET
jgi:predicted transcriptional regulator YheO